MRNVVYILSMCFLLTSCGKRKYVYSYVIKNNTKDKIEVVVYNNGSNGIIQEEINKEIITIVSSGQDVTCYEHIAKPENFNGRELVRLDKWEYIVKVEVYRRGIKSPIQYLESDLEFYYMQGIVGSNQGIYTINVNDSDWGSVMRK